MRDSECKASVEIANNARQLLSKKKLEPAYIMIKEGAELYPESMTLTMLCSDVCRLMDKRKESLTFAKRLIQSHPGVFEGYVRATHDLLCLKKDAQAIELIENGLKRFPDNKWILHASLVAHNSAKNYARSREMGLTLSRMYPGFKAFYKPYCEALVMSGLAHQAYEFIDSLDDSESSIILRLNVLLGSRNYSEYNTRLLTYLVNSPEVIKKEIPERLFQCQHLLVNGSDHLQARYPTGVDVICIASDEAPYIAEFIHHYIYLGFRNIYIGVNNCRDSTVEITQAISKGFSQVKYFIVDHIISTYGQHGCYSYLFNIARAQSDSHYCLIVDVDEFWIASPFPRSIGDYIGNAIPFDAYSFHWLTCSKEGQFAPPLSCAAITFKPQLKTICNYNTEYLRLDAHGPIIANIDNPRMLFSNKVNNCIRKTTTGYTVLPKVNDPNLSPKSASLRGAYVFHRMLRSEIEYCCRLFKINNSYREKLTFKPLKGKVSFKRNRFGFKDHPPSDESTKFLEAALPRHEIDAYHLSLERFVRSVDIDQLLSTSRSLISEDFIWSSLRSVEPDILKANALLLRRIFSRTRFHDWVVSQTEGHLE